MLEEVLSRIDLIIAVEGRRRISRENLTFLFNKYELSEEERSQVLQCCRDRQIELFDESTAVPAAGSEEQQEQENSVRKLEAEPAGKKGFFARLFGR